MLHILAIMYVSYVRDFYCSDKSYLRYKCFTNSTMAFLWNPFFDLKKKYQGIQWLQIQKAAMVFLKCTYPSNFLQSTKDGIL